MNLYIIALLIGIFAWCIRFRKALKKSGMTVAAALHAFATEYNDAYAVDGKNEEKEE
jgi:hypothetical protein